MLYLNRRLGQFLRLLFIVFAAILLSALMRPGAASGQSASPSPSARPTPHPISSAQDALLSFLDRVLDWYRLSKLPPEAPLDPALMILVSGTRESSLAIVKTAFSYARAYAQLLEKSAAAQDDGGKELGAFTLENKSGQKNSSPIEERFAQRRAELEQRVAQLTVQIDRLKQDVAAAPEAQKGPLLTQLNNLQNQLRLDRVRLDFFTQFEKFEQNNTDVSEKGKDLLDKINEMEASVPELSLGQKASLAGDKANRVAAVQYPAPGSGIWGKASLLFALEKEQQRVTRLAQMTARLAQEFGQLSKAMRVKAQDLVHQLQELAAQDVSSIDPALMNQRNEQFGLMLAELRSLASVLAPAEAARSQLMGYQTNLTEYRMMLRHRSYRALQDLLQQALMLSIVFGFIFGGAVLWRHLAVKYVLDPRRYHQLMVFRTVTVVIVSVLVLTFKFATDLTALATIMGFAAAGIAFALQNVILSAIGYFSIIGRNGVRVGDRVGLQGAFGYVYGEITELGVLRIQMRELSGGPDNWAPTGRTVVFPNSVVFTGSFVKLPRSLPSTRHSA